MWGLLKQLSNKLGDAVQNSNPNNNILNRSLRQALAAGLLLALAASTAQADANIYRQTLKSTTWVLAKNSDGTSSGAGVFIDTDKKLVMTNAHVVGDARNTVVFFPEVKNGRPIVDRDHYLENVKKLGIKGRVIAVDRKRDLALIQLAKLPQDAKAIELADEGATPGEEVESIGNAGTTEALWVYASGTVRAVYQKQFRTGAGEHDFKVVETQSPINSGDSGGPVVNSKGKLVAVSQAISTKARLVSYCVDISEVKTFLASPWKAAPLPVKNLLESAELAYTQHASTGHFQVEMGVDDDAKESVFITKDVEYFKRADVRKIWALARASKEAPSQDTMMRLMQQSARTKIGSWTIEQNAQGDYLVIYCVKLDATATHDTVKSTMEYVAKLTTAMKKELAPAKAKEDSTETLNKWLAD